MYSFVLYITLQELNSSNANHSHNAARKEKYSIERFWTTVFSECNVKLGLKSLSKDRYTQKYEKCQQ